VQAMSEELAEKLSSGRPVPDWQPHEIFGHPHLVQKVVAPEVVQEHLTGLLGEVSGGSWVYQVKGTPASRALGNSFGAGRNEADFSDAAQTGKHVGELYGKTAFTDDTATVSAWPKIKNPRVLAVADSGDLSASMIGSALTGAGHSVSSATNGSVGLNAAFRAKQPDAHQTTGNYGLTWTPYQRGRTTTESASLTANPANTTEHAGPLALVVADVDWHLAARYRHAGLAAPAVNAVTANTPKGRV
ncbi:hypothetical protein ADK38_16825, partial [Streptomyces varsoviensis]